MALCGRRLLISGALLSSSAVGLVRTEDAAALKLDPCRCRSWRYTYSKPETPGHACGHFGPEFWFYSQHNFYPKWELEMMIKTDVCDRFFNRLLGNTCVNWDMAKLNKTTLETEQWCFVGPECKVQDGHISDGEENFGLRVCKPGVDDMYSAYGLADLKEEAANFKIDIATMLRFSYPTYSDLSWPMVKSWFINGTGDLFDEEIADLERVVASEKFVIFDHGKGYPSKDDEKTWNERAPWQPVFGIVKGKKVYEVDFVENFAALMDHGLKDLSMMPHLFKKIYCLKNCEGFESEKPTYEPPAASVLAQQP